MAKIQRGILYEHMIQTISLLSLMIKSIKNSTRSCGIRIQLSNCFGKGAKQINSFQINEQKAQLEEARKMRDEAKDELTKWQQHWAKERTQMQHKQRQDEKVRVKVLKHESVWL